MRNRDFNALTTAQLVAGRIEKRRVDVSGLLSAPAAKPIAELLDTIQHVDEAATGERSFLHKRFNSAK